MVELSAVASLPFELRRASPDDQDVVVSLVEDAVRWLREEMQSDQWSKPWPSQAEQDRRLVTDLQLGRTWIAWDGAIAAATITADPDEDPRWPELQYKRPAIYIQRLVVSRLYPRRGLGARLLDWAGLRGQRDHGADWIRVNCWTSNTVLHDYYVRQGFRFCEFSDDLGGCPSRARFQRRANYRRAAGRALFIEMPDVA